MRKDGSDNEERDNCQRGTEPDLEKVGRRGRGEAEMKCNAGLLAAIGEENRRT